MGKTQRDRILAHLQRYGNITPQEALRHYGSFRLAAHIEVYRKAGHRIATKMVTERGSEFARYIYEEGQND